MLLCCTFLLVSCGGAMRPVAEAGQVEVPPVVSLRVTKVPLPDGHSAVKVSNKGTGDVRVSVARINNGQLRGGTDPTGARALRFPPYSPSDPAPAVVLGVWNSSKSDQLSPGTRAFSFGADFRLDKDSYGRPSDNGDNLIQRGFFSSTAQYKIQVDKRVPSCRIQGERGSVFVEAKAEVANDTWYRVDCSRQGDRVNLRVQVLGANAPGDVREYVTYGPTGDVTMDDPRQPLTVGGKMNGDGRVTESSVDQFNGAVANVYFNVEGPSSP